MKIPKIPFDLLPTSWGLKGKSRQRARAEYELVGYELACKLAEIDSVDELDLQLRLLDIKLQYKILTEYDHAHQKAELCLSDVALSEQKLLVDLKYNRISKQQYDKQLADIKNEPWVCITDVKWNPNDPSRSYFELDYNEYFIHLLRAHDYHGTTPEELVEKWLNQVCKSVAWDMELEDPGFVSEALNIRKNKNPNNLTEYS